MAKSAFTFVKTAAGSAGNPLASLAQVAGTFTDAQLKKGSKSFNKAKDQYLATLGFTRSGGHWYNPDGTRASYEQKVAALKTVGTPNGPSAGTPGFPGAGGAVNHTPLNFNVASLPPSGFVPGTRAQDWLTQAFASPYMQGWGSPAGAPPASTTPGTPTPTGNGGAGQGNGNPATGGVPTGGGGGGTGLGGNQGGSTGQGGFPIGSGGVPAGGVGTGWGSGTGTFGGGSSGTPSGSGAGSIFGGLLGMAGGGSISGSVIQALANAGVGWAQNLLNAGNGATNPATGFGTFSGQPMTDPSTAQIANWNPTGGSTSGGWLQGSNPVSWAPTPGTGNYDVNPQADLSAVDALGTPRLNDGRGSGGGAGGGSVRGGFGSDAGSSSIGGMGRGAFVQNATNIGSLLSWLGGGAGGGTVFNYAVK